MPWLSILEALSRILPAVATATVAVLHLTGADKHKTVAGTIADGLNKAGVAAAAANQFFLNGVQHGDPSRDPPT